MAVQKSKQKKIVKKRKKSNKYELSPECENEDLIEEESSDIETEDKEPSDIESEDNLQMRNQDNKQNEKPVDRHKFQCGEFILVKFNTEKQVVKYVGEICQAIDGEYLQVKFLGKTVVIKGTYFLYPDIIDESMVNRNEVVCLPAPKPLRRRRLTFLTDLVEDDNVL
ncbi:hypothetical protein JTB14_025981 [Gonioctena quinquepunctata]|nr:hypothetical protein JTB14_025981 [Gonioctena quinquepunctata]